MATVVLVTTLPLLPTLAVLLDEAFAAVPDAGFRAGVAARAVVGADRRRRRRLAAGPVTLVRGGAGRRLRQHEEAAPFTRVVELHRLPVLVVDRKDIAGEEVGVNAVGGD